MNFKEVIAPKVNKLLGRAMHDFKMLEDGDRVLLGLSGGVDSMVLAWILQEWQKKAPIAYDVQCITVDNEYWKDSPHAFPPEKSIGSQMKTLGISHKVVKAWDLSREEMTCYLCARNRRNLLFDIAKKEGFTKIALGHHKDDLLETFMLNIIYSGNISTMMPHQRLFDDSLGIIRPMAYLEKTDVIKVAEKIGIKPVKNYCPLSDDTRREKVRSILENIYTQEPEAKRSLFASLSNVREEYMLPSDIFK